MMKNLNEMDTLDLQDYINTLRGFTIRRLEEELRMWQMVGEALKSELNRRERQEEAK